MNAYLFVCLFIYLFSTDPPYVILLTVYGTFPVPGSRYFLLVKILKKTHRVHTNHNILLLISELKVIILKCFPRSIVY